MSNLTEHNGYCEKCRSTYRRSYPHSCDVLDLTDARARLEAWFAGDIEIYE